MHIQDLRIDRFGVCRSLHVDALTEGLNVFFGPRTAGRGSVVPLLKAVLFGLPSAARHRCPPPDARAFAGAMTVADHSGSLVLIRRDDGSAGGRLTVRHPDGRPAGDGALRGVLPGVPATTWDRVFCVDFSRRPQLDELLDEAAAWRLGTGGAKAATRRCQALLQRHREQLDALPLVDVPVEVLREQRRLLAEEIKDIANRGSALQAEHVRRTGLAEREMAEQRQLLRADTSVWPPPPVPAAAPRCEVRRCLRSLQFHIARLQSLIGQWPAGEGEAACQPLRESCAPRLKAMRASISRLSRALNSCPLVRQQDDRSSERAHVACERDREIQDLAARRQATLDRTQDDQKVLAERRQRLRRLEHDIRIAEQRKDLRARIAALEAEMQRASECPPDGDLTRHAEAYLRRLSAGNLTGVQTRGKRSVEIVDERGTRHTYQQLTEGQRDQVYLSFCLGFAAMLRRRGVSCPLVLDEIFTRLESHVVPRTAELLRDLGDEGQQILVFTAYEHVASVFRLLNVPVRQLDAMPAAGLEGAQRAEVPSPPALLFPLEGAEEEEEPEYRFRPWDAEEFPGELTDRVRWRPRSVAHRLAGPRGAQTAGAARRSLGEREQDAAAGCSPPGGNVPSDPEFYLTEQDAVEDAPLIDRANVERLRRIGILRVGDLLRVSPPHAAAALRHAGVTPDMFAAWQAQARLVCRVPRLRPYDARILVACGITTPEQLARTTARRLWELVKEFAASSVGQAVLLSGTEQELSRVTQWIQSARHGRLRHCGPAPEERRDRGGTGQSIRGHSEGSAAVPEPSEVQSSPATAGSQAAEPPGPIAPAAAKRDPIVKLPRRGGVQFYLERRSPVVDAPSIGPRMAARLRDAGVHTVEDLLRADPRQLAGQLRDRRITGETVQIWQQQAALACRVPGLRGRDAQMLVAVGITDLQQLAQADADSLWQKVACFLQTRPAKRVLRGTRRPDLEEVRRWILRAAESRTLHAA